MMERVRLTGTILLNVGLICGVISTAINYWYYLRTTTEKIESLHFGLWTICNKSVEATVCHSWDPPDWMNACRAMMVIGTILNVVAVVHVIHALMKHTAARRGQGSAFIGGICYVIAAAVFVAKYEGELSSGQTGGHLHAGFGLAIVAAIFNLIPVSLIGNAPACTGYQIL